jgi:23S rRNA (cytosine1962-C5)-methyltransferase
LEKARGRDKNGAPRRAPGRLVTLKPGRDKPVVNRHPWVFSGAIDSIGDALSDGDVADVVSHENAFLARGVVNRRSQIVVRLLTWRADELVDAAFFATRIGRAVSARPRSGPARLVHAESDGLPGLVVDRYGDYCVIQVSALGIDARKAAIVEGLASATDAHGIYERSDVEGREKEGLEATTGLLFGTEPPDLIRVEERTHDGQTAMLLVDVRHGHKTGTYLDQTNNRRSVGAVANGADVLNLFSYTGGFGLHAAKAGARHVVNVDSSADALALSERAAKENGVDSLVEHVRADAFDALRRFREEGRTFDVVIVDPPKFAHTASQVERAARAYKDLSRVAFHLVRSGGFLATFSCSGAVSSDLFQKIVWSASVEAARDAQIVERLTQPADHPVLLSFPEGEYLKGLLCRVE